MPKAKSGKRKAKRVVSSKRTLLHLARRRAALAIAKRRAKAKAYIPVTQQSPLIGLRADARATWTSADGMTNLIRSLDTAHIANCVRHIDQRIAIWTLIRNQHFYELQFRLAGGKAEA